jgi:hypothetical protein
VIPAAVLLLQDSTGSAPRWCRTRLNPANITVRLRVIKAAGHGGLATALSGTYTVDAPTNPPNCRSNGHGEQGMHGTR